MQGYGAETMAQNMGLEFGTKALHYDFRSKVLAIRSRRVHASKKVLLYECFGHRRLQLLRVCGKAFQFAVFHVGLGFESRNSFRLTTFGLDFRFRLFKGA